MDNKYQLNEWMGGWMENEYQMNGWADGCWE